MYVNILEGFLIFFVTMLFVTVGHFLLESLFHLLVGSRYS